MRRHLHLGVDGFSALPSVRNPDLQLGPLDRLFDSSKHRALVASVDAPGSVDHSLRRIGTLPVESRRVALLPFGHIRRRKWISPAFVVPVIYMLAQNDYTRAGHGLFAVDRLQQSVGGWATRTSFRREQLDQNRSLGNRIRGGEGVARDQSDTKECRGAKRDSGRKREDFEQFLMLALIRPGLA